MAQLWQERMNSLVKAQVANVFLLHGNVSDLQPLNGALGSKFVPLRDVLPRITANGSEPTICYYDIASGFRFPDESHERNLREYTGLTKPKPRTLEEKQAMDAARRRRELQTGAEESDEDPPLPKDPFTSLKLIEMILEGGIRKHPGKHRFVVVIEYVDALTVNTGQTPNNNPVERVFAVLIQRWARESRFQNSGNIAVLVADRLGDVSKTLCTEPIEALEVPLPDYNERLAYIKHLSSEYKFDSPLTEVAGLSAGLNRSQLLNLCKRAQAKDEKLTAQAIRERKKAVIERDYSDLIEVMEPRFGLDAIGGLDQVKTYLNEVAEAMRKGDHLLVPMGLMLMGPPGTGKSALAEALAQAAGFNFLRIVNPRTSFVGESERRFWTALRVVRAFAPVVVLEDEADQSEQSRDEWVGDSGVSNRIRQMRFEFTADPAIRGRVLWIRITNRPDKIDAAEMRSGRSSERIPLLMPNETEKVKIFEVMPRKLGIKCDLGDFSAVVAELSKRHGQTISGADIEEIFVRAHRHALRNGQKAVGAENLNWAIGDLIPSHDPEEVRRMEEQAIANCSSRRFLPSSYQGATAEPLPPKERGAKWRFFGQHNR